MRAKLIQFFKDRPGLKKYSVEREAGLPRWKLKEVLSNKQYLSVEQKKQLESVLTKYGWKE
ncbi:MAG: hypothetical protein AAGA85_11770 [Bacteroidota bacterium]